jgi:hypothetical protein
VKIGAKNVQHRTVEAALLREQIVPGIHVQIPKL